MPIVSPSDFLRAFAGSWFEIQQQGTILAGHPFVGMKAWTESMLSPQSGLLKSVAESLKTHDPNMQYRKELYTVDAAFLGGENLYRTGLEYPSAVHVLVEHELDERVEEEMWKLIHWRAPLKVLMFYDWPDDEKARIPSRRIWANNKIEKLAQMIDAVDRFHGEEKATNYLFLLGGRPTTESAIRWRYASNKSQTLVELVPAG